jgi:type II secretory pathway pseudopilin PulG
VQPNGAVDRVVEAEGARRAPGRGFTLVEVLVIISLIMLLLALLLPPLGQTRDAARKTLCAGNLRQQGQAMNAYTVDYNGFYPGCHGLASATGRPLGVWVTRIRAYAAGERGIFDDPAAPIGFRWQVVFGAPGGAYAVQQDVQKWGYTLGELLLDVHRVPSSYGYNDWGRYNVVTSPQQYGLGGDLWNPNSTEIPETMVVSPSQMFAVMESTSDGDWDYNVDPTDPHEYPGKYHFEGTNTLFCDDHVEWFLQKDLINVNLSTSEGQSMSRHWNNTNSP